MCAHEVLVEVDAHESCDAIPIVPKPRPPATAGVEHHGAGAQRLLEQSPLDDGVVGLHRATLDGWSRPEPPR